jgi:hypothetical protein
MEAPTRGGTLKKGAEWTDRRSSYHSGSPPPGWGLKPASAWSTSLGGTVPMDREINPGRYRHYKGNEYTVLGLARHSETHEELVVYRQEYGDRSLWVRPKKMFLETVILDGQEVPRFCCLEDEP